MEIRSFFQVSPNDLLDGRILSQRGSSITSQVFVAREFNTLHEQQNFKTKVKKFLKKLGKVYEHGNLLFQMVKNWPKKFHQTTNSLEKL